jgi:hypothetical protein
MKGESTHVGDLDGNHEETLSLLQEEIVRLDGELRLRDELLSSSPEVPDVRDPPQAGAGAGKMAELTAELRQRDETISLLLEEVRLVGEAEAAGRAEWEQLHQWIEQVEVRVDSRDQQDSQLEEQLAAERRQVEARRQSDDTERRAWEDHRRTLELEVERLRSRLAAAAQQAAPDADLAVGALEDENLRLREAHAALILQAAAAADLIPTRARLEESLARVHTLEDDLERQRNEFEVALAALRTQFARDTLQQRQGPGTGPPAGAQDPNASTSVDERIRAFRQHLQDVHRVEQEERSKKRLSARLSRLWTHTSPSR